ncbi:MAG: 3-deoxy-manno-octulosonate cytidylyltransferase [Desulfobacteraceae bacterium]|nr:MAG: 3-deoxy-manno-octulosonate cytidylyltransferase [Desulfobacteraceae bacterium]
MKIVAFIPARLSSTRFPGKPLALIAGMPMIEHTYMCTRACPEVSDVFVATDDQEIVMRVREFGGKAILTSEVHPSGTDRVAEAASSLGLKNDDVVVNVQGDQPFFSPVLISDMLRPVLTDAEIPMSTLKCPVSDPNEVADPNCVKVVTDNQDFALFFSRSPVPFVRDPLLHRTYYKHLGFYCYRMEFLVAFSALPVGTLEAIEKLEQLRALENGYRIKVVETNLDSIEVDTPADIKRVEALMARSRSGHESGHS